MIEIREEFVSSTGIDNSDISHLYIYLYFNSVLVAALEVVWSSAHNFKVPTPFQP